MRVHFGPFLQLSFPVTGVLLHPAVLFRDILSSAHQLAGGVSCWVGKIKFQLYPQWLERNEILEEWKHKGGACCTARGTRARLVHWVLQKGCGSKKTFSMGERCVQRHFTQLVMVPLVPL